MKKPCIHYEKNGIIKPLEIADNQMLIIENVQGAIVPHKVNKDEILLRARSGDWHAYRPIEFGKIELHYQDKKLMKLQRYKLSD